MCRNGVEHLNGIKALILFLIFRLFGCFINFDSLFLQIFDAAASDRALCLQRLSKTVSQLDWKNYSGVVGLIVKGWLFFASGEWASNLRAAEE